MDKRTLMLAGLITEAEYRKSKEKKPLNEANLRKKIRTLVKESLLENDLTSYIEQIKSGDFDFDTAYVWLKDQGLSTNQIDSIMSQLDSEGYEFSLDEAKKKKDEEEDITIDDTEELDTEETDTDLDMDFETESPEGDSDLNNIETDLEAALEKAKTAGDEKLITQIENTITMLTRMQFTK